MGTKSRHAFFIQAQSKIARFYAVTLNPSIERLLSGQLGRRLKLCFEAWRSMEADSDQLAANRQLAAAARQVT